MNEVMIRVCESRTDEQKQADKKLVQEIELWNKEATELLERLSNALKEKFPENTVTLELKRFGNIREKEGLEYYKPRNYLSFEKIKVSGYGKTTEFFFGEYKDLTYFKGDCYKYCKNLILGLINEKDNNSANRVPNKLSSVSSQNEQSGKAEKGRRGLSKVLGSIVVGD